MSDVTVNPGLAVFLRSRGSGAVRFAIDISATALAAGEFVKFVVFAEAIAGFLEAARDEHVAHDLLAVRALARHQGSFEVLACSGGVEDLGLDPDTLVTEGVVDDVVGMPAIWRRTRTLRLLCI